MGRMVGGECCSLVQRDQTIAGQMMIPRRGNGEMSIECAASDERMMQDMLTVILICMG